ncbi:hypothetical protein [Daejeonella sp.]|uniref:hypothetical protein n=1 Tax=Daejeonella sp. TaxID=2805397 RepID=UPI0030BD81FF
MHGIVLLVLFFLNEFQCDFQAPVRFPEFEKYVLKNYRATKQQRSECKFIYACIVVQTDKFNKIIDLQFKNDVSGDMKSSLSFLKGYEFHEKYKIAEKPILFFLTVDQQDICPMASDTTNVTILVLKESLTIIKTQIGKNSESIILYDVIPVKIFKPSH